MAFRPIALAVFLLLSSLNAGNAAVLVATYQFNNDLDADQIGVASLVPINGSLSAFEAATVFGASRTVYRNFVLDPDAAMAGYSLNTSALITDGTDYSIEMIVSMDSLSAYNRLIANTSPISDNGLYLANNKITLYNGTGHAGSSTITTNEFVHVVMTTSGNVAKAYLNGNLEVTLSGSLMNIDVNNLLRFFIDDIQEYSNGRTALMRVYNGELGASDINNLWLDPFADLSSETPEPGTWALMLAGAVVLGGTRALRRKLQAI